MPALALAASPESIAEEDDDSTTGTVENVSTVTASITNSKTFATDQVLSLAFGGSATYGTHYTVTPADGDANETGHQVTLAAGQDSVSVTVAAEGNDTADGDRDITIAGALGGASFGSPATIALRDDDNTPATGAPAIRGTAQVGETLSASTDGITDPDGKPANASDYTYQWQSVDEDGTSNETDIGTDSSTYTPVAADVGKRIRVKVSFTDDVGHNEGPLTSAATAAVTVVPPAIVANGVQVTSTPRAAPDTYGPGETIELTVTFDKAVTVDTTGATAPRIQFRLGPPRTDRWAAYSSGSGTTALKFTYEVQSGDTDSDGIWLPENELQLRSGTIRDTGHQHRRRHPRLCPGRPAERAQGGRQHAGDGRAGDYRDGAGRPDAERGAPATSPTATASTTRSSATSGCGWTAWPRWTYRGRPPTPTSWSRPMWARRSRSGRASPTTWATTRRAPAPRPRRSPVPVTIEAEHTSIGGGLEDLVYTLTRAGDTADALSVTVTLTQDETWLTAANLSHTVTFNAGEAEKGLTIPAADFSLAPTTKGDLTATVSGDGVDGDSVDVEVISIDHEPVTIAFDKTAYSFPESGAAEEVDIYLTATVDPAFPRPPAENLVRHRRFATFADTATVSPEDLWRGLSSVADVNHSRRTSRRAQTNNRSPVFCSAPRADNPLVIVDNDAYEGDETFDVQIRRYARRPIERAWFASRKPTAPSAPMGAPTFAIPSPSPTRTTCRSCRWPPRRRASPRRTTTPPPARSRTCPR